jgi:Tol biopolymer transport system component
MAWSPGGRWLAGFCVLGCPADGDATGGIAAPLHLIDRRTGRLHRTLSMAAHPDGGGASAVFSPDDALVAVSHQSDVERLFRTDNGALVRTVREPAVYDAASFSPDGSRLVIGSALGGTTLLALPRGDVVRIDTVSNLFAVAAPVGFAWSPSGDRLVVTRAGSEVRDARTGARIAEIPGGRDANDVLVRFENDGRSALLTACDGLVERIVFAPFAIDVLRAPSRNGPCGLAASRDGARLFRGTSAGLDVFDVASRSSRELVSRGQPRGAPFHSPDGRWIAQARLGEGDGGSANADVVVFDVEQTAAPVVLDGDGVIGWSANGELYRAASGDLVAWSPPAGADVFHAAFEAPTVAPRLSPDGRFVALADGQLVLVRTSDHAVLRVSIANEGRAPHVVPDAAQIAAFMR